MTDFPRYAEWVNELTPKAAGEARDVLREVTRSCGREFRLAMERPLYHRVTEFPTDVDFIALTDFEAIVRALSIRAGSWLACMSAEHDRHRAFLESIRTP